MKKETHFNFYFYYSQQEEKKILRYNFYKNFNVNIVKAAFKPLNL